jgi:drug/metabolite transporter (DMT)-like permease
MQNILLYVLSTLIWGSTWYVIKFQLGLVDPALSVAYRFTLAAILMLAFGFATGRLHTKSFTRKQWGFVVLQGFFLFFLNYWFTYHSTLYLTSGLVAVTFSLVTFMNIINQRIFFKIPIRKEVLIGSALGLTGIGLVFWPELASIEGHKEILLGIALCAIGTYSASLGNMTAYRNSRDSMPVFAVSAWGMAFGAAFSYITALSFGAELQFDYSFNYLWSLIYLAVLGSAVAFVAYLTLLARIGADKASYSAIIVPIVALAISTVFEGYTWTPIAVLGVAFTLVGNVLALKKSKA